MEIIFLLFLHLKHFINLTKRIYCIGTVAKCVSKATADTATPAAIQCHGMHARLLALLILPDPPRQRWQSNQTRSCQENGCGKVYLVCVCVCTIVTSITTGPLASRSGDQRILSTVQKRRATYFEAPDLRQGRSGYVRGSREGFFSSTSPSSLSSFRSVPAFLPPICFIMHSASEPSMHSSGEEWQKESERREYC